MAEGTVELEGSERDALRLAYENHYVHLVRMCGLLVGSRKAAEDIVQEAFVRGASRIADLPPHEVRPCLRTAVANEWKNRRRRMDLDRRARVRLAPTGSDGERTDAGHNEMWQAVLRLAPKQRACLVLRFYEDLSEKETARVLGVSVGHREEPDEPGALQDAQGARAMKIEERVRNLLRDQAQRIGPAGDALPDILRRVAEPPEIRGSRASRRLVAAIVAFATFAAAGLFLWSAFGPATRHPAGETGDPWASVGTGWTQLPTPPDSRQEAAYAWTGRELISWGGHLPTMEVSPPLADGFIFDPSAMSWRRMPAAPIARSYATAVWTGSEVLFWGGRGPDGSLATDGAAFDPSTLAWRTIPEAPLEPRDPAAVVWTGSEMIVWGGGPSRAQTYTDGAAYDPASDSWRTIANAPIALNLASGIWTGHEVIVFGSNLNNRNIADTKTSIGEAHDPTTDTWRTLPPSQLSPQATSAVWLEDRMLAWDYDTHYQVYDPGTDSWTPPQPMPIEPSECYPDSVAIGHLAFAWFCGDAAIYDGDAGTWQRLEGGPLDQTIHTSKVDIKLWRFATPVPAGDAVLLAMEGVTLTKGGEACYGCPGAPDSLWVYLPTEVRSTPITPSAIPFPEGSITVSPGAIPEGDLLFQLGATAEILPSDSDHSLRLGEFRVQELSPDGRQVLAVDGDRLTAIDLSTGAQTRLAEVGAGEYILMAEWSPDGGFVAYRLGLGNPTGFSKACVVDVATQQQNCPSGLGDVYTLHWAPDGVHLIVAGPGQGVESVAIDSGEVSTLVPAEGSPTVTAALQKAGYGSPIQFVDPSWSPSGNYIGALVNMRGGECGLCARGR